MYWQVTVQLPGPGAPGARTVTTAADDDSDDHITNNTVTDPKSINTDAPAPNSYICLGYTFSIIAGFCFTSWLVPHTPLSWHITNCSPLQQCWYQDSWSPHPGQLMANVVGEMYWSEPADGATDTVHQVTSPGHSWLQHQVETGSSGSDRRSPAPVYIWSCTETAHRRLYCHLLLHTHSHSAAVNCAAQGSLWYLQVIL